MTLPIDLNLMHSSEKGEVLKSPSDAIVEGHQPMKVIHNSNKKNVFVGLINQGATCYMNSLLQTLYHLPFFRKAVYHMPTTEKDFPSSRLPLALQRLFCKLQTSNTTVETRELMESLELTPAQLFVQQDAQEYNRLLFEKLEPKMKGTVVEDKLNQFEGHIKSYVKCINIDWISTTNEPYYDIQLDVRGCKNIYDSFDKYVEVESLTGDNKYHTEQHGLQDVRKGLLFIDFPPVLQLHLKRFELVKGETVKINDRHEFPLQLDLGSHQNYTPPAADASVCNVYTLYSVLVHRGEAGGGHYYVYIRPTLGEQWVKFEDAIVTEVDKEWTLEELYGRNENPSLNNFQCSSAYMLVYIRESDKERLFCHVDEKDFPEHLRGRVAIQEGLTSDSTPSDGTTLDTLPPQLLLHAQAFPKSHRIRDAPQNVTTRLRSRESKYLYAGFLGRQKDSQFAYSKIRKWKNLDWEDSHPTSISFLGEQTQIAIGNNNGAVRVHDFRKNEDLATYQAHQNKVTLLDSYFSGNRKLILSSTEREVLLWDSVAEGAKNRFLKRTVGRFSNNGTMFSSSSLPVKQHQKAYLTDIETNGSILTIKDSPRNIQPPSEVHFNISDTLLLWRGQVYDTRSPDIIHHFLPDTHSYHGDPDYWGGGFPPARVNEVIVNSGVWDMRNYSLLRYVPSFNDARITFTVDNNVLYAVTKSCGGFHTLDAVTYSFIGRTFPCYSDILSFSVDQTNTFIGCVTESKHRATLLEIGRPDW